MSDDKLLQKLSQNSPKLTPDNKPNDKKKPHEEANDNPIKESSKMAPQYKVLNKKISNTICLIIYIYEYILMFIL